MYEMYVIFMSNHVVFCKSKEKVLFSNYNAWIVYCLLTQEIFQVILDLLSYNISENIFYWHYKYIIFISQETR